MLPFSAVSRLMNIGFGGLISMLLELVNEYADIYTLFLAFWFPSFYCNCVFQKRVEKSISDFARDHAGGHRSPNSEPNLSG